MAVQLVPDRREYAVADEGEAHGVVVRRERPQAREHDYGQRREREQRARVDGVEERKPADAVAPGRGDDTVQHDLERPGLEQSQADLDVEREQRRDDEGALAAQVGPEAPREPPQSGEGIAQRQRPSHTKPSPGRGAPAARRWRVGARVSRPRPTYGLEARSTARPAPAGCAAPARGAAAPGRRRALPQPPPGT